jgi:hypothetical protein
MFLIVAFVLSLLHVYSMPYHAPLQGEPGGKRTLVLMDSLVRFLRKFVVKKFNVFKKY